MIGRVFSLVGLGDPTFLNRCGRSKVPAVPAVAVQGPPGRFSRFPFLLLTWICIVAKGLVDSGVPFCLAEPPLCNPFRAQATHL